MAVQDIFNYSYKNIFSLSVVQFEKACVFNKPEQLDTYSIYWIKEGTGVYNVIWKSNFDFNLKSNKTVKTKGIKKFLKQLFKN